MCRLFGFRSVISSQIHSSLVEADNAILHQSNFHSDGWGVAYYLGGAPHLVRSTSAAVEDTLFKKVSGIVASETLVAHLRKATQGNLCITNAHPFQYGRWIFAHNGNIANFKERREQLLARISPLLRRYILGTTDSEVLFYLLLSHLSRRVELHRTGCRLDALKEAVTEALSELFELIGPLHHSDDGPATENYTTFIITDGSTMLGFNGGKTLYYSTYKTRCSERDTCPCFSPECEAETSTEYVNHMLLASEPIQGENVWLKMELGQMVGVDWNMRFKNYQMDVPIAAM